MENEIEAIRERHEAEIREPNKWTFNRAETAHADRATLLRALDAMAEENARMKEALKPFAEARLESWGQRTQGVGDYLTRVWINTAPNVAVSNARAALKEPGQ